MENCKDVSIAILKEQIEQNGLHFLSTVSKLTAMTELIRQYEPAGHDESWEALQGIAQIIGEITDECHIFRESTMEIFQAIDNNLSELFGSHVPVRRHDTRHAARVWDNGLLFPERGRYSGKPRPCPADFGGAAHDRHFP